MTARLTLLSSFLILLAVLAAAPARAIESPAEYISLMDYDTGEIIYEKNGTELMAPASMSKLMTMVMLFDAIRGVRAAKNASDAEAFLILKSVGGSTQMCSMGPETDVQMSHLR